MPTAYDKEGRAVQFQFSIDWRDAIRRCGYTAEPPEGKEPPKPEQLSADEMKEVSEVAEKARLGAVVSPEERELLNKAPGQDPRLDEKGAVHEVGSYPEGEHPGALGGAQTSPGTVPGSPAGGVSGSVANAGAPGAPVTSGAVQEQGSAPESQEVADDFNPTTADRAALFDYLRRNGEDAHNALSTTELRERANKKIGTKKKGE